MTAVKYVHNNLVHNTRAAEEVLPFLFDKINPKQVIDIGCGTGSWLYVAKKIGAENILGVDGIYIDKGLLCIDEKDFLQHDLTKPIKLSQKFDLAICLEVAEHLPDEHSDNLINILTQHADIILFSAAIPGQGGQYHVNEQYPFYWQKKFNKMGFSACDILRDKFWNNKNVEWWYKQNMLLYFKEDNNQYKFGKTESIQIKVHPELFETKIKQINELQQYIQTNITYPKFWPSLKRLVKSVW